MSFSNSWRSFAAIDARRSLHLRAFQRHTKNRKKCSFQNVLQFVANECRAAMGWRCALLLALQLYYYIIYIWSTFRGIWGDITIFQVLRLKPSLQSSQFNYSQSLFDFDFFFSLKKCIFSVTNLRHIVSCFHIFHLCFTPAFTSSL